MLADRLESPISHVRDMAARVAFAFSLSIDPEKPLWIDDSDKGRDLLEWKSLLPAARSESRKENLVHNPNFPASDSLAREPNKMRGRQSGNERQKAVDVQEDDPDAVVNYAGDDIENWRDDDVAGSSDAESESSLQPYDMLDDEGDLERGNYPVQLMECAMNLRKGDNADAVSVLTWSKELRMSSLCFLCLPSIRKRTSVISNLRKVL